MKFGTCNKNCSNQPSSICCKFRGHRAAVGWQSVTITEQGRLCGAECHHLTTGNICKVTTRSVVYHRPIHGGVKFRSRGVEASRLVCGSASDTCHICALAELTSFLVTYKLTDKKAFLRDTNCLTVKVSCDMQTD